MENFIQKHLVKLVAVGLMVIVMVLYVSSSQKKRLSFDALTGMSAPERADMTNFDIGVAFAESISKTGVSQRALVKYLGQVRDNLNQVRTALTGSYLLTAPVLSTSEAKVSYTGMSYSVAGHGYQLDSGTITLSGSAMSTSSVYGAYAFEVGTNRTIDTVPATGNAAGFLSSAAAVTAIDATTVTANHARIGTMVILDVNEAFEPGTSVISGAGNTVTYDYGDCPGDTLTNSALSLEGL